MKKGFIQDKFSEKKQELINRCTLCCICVDDCQIYPFGRFASEDSVELQEARIDFLKYGGFSQQVYDLAYDCTNCLYCGDVITDFYSPDSSHQYAIETGS